MQLLLRRAAQTGLAASATGEAVLAASPDSLARAAWLWDVRVVARGSGQAAAYDGAGVGEHDLVVRTAEGVVVAEQSRLELAAPTRLTRPRDELWLALVETGAATTGAFAVAPGDVLVWEGDDPTVVDLAPTGPGTAVALVALRRLDGAQLRWVP
jgi:hypothetical protein